MEQLAKALREEMARRGHSYRQAATTMGVSMSSVRNWFHGFLIDVPNRRHRKVLAEYLGVAEFIILGWTDELTTEQVDLLRTIPGSLTYANALALVMVSRPGYLKPAAGTVLVAS